MTAFCAIVKLTCRSAIRSNIFRTLLFFLLLSVVLVPNTIRGDGTAQGFIQVILEYSLAFVSFILSISTIWISCSELCSDVESGQIHMIAVKPVSRLTVWLGKFSGVLLIHTVLLLISAAAIYGFVLFQYERQNFTPEEKEQLQNEVFAGRRVYMPDLPVIKDLAAAELDRRVKDAASRGERIPELDSNQRSKYLESITTQVIANMGEIKPGEIKAWNYSGLPEASDMPLFLRYKAFSGSTYNTKEALAHGTWIIRGMQPEYAPGDEQKIVGYTPFYIQKPPEDILCGSPKEFAVPAEAVIHQGTAEFRFVNMTRDDKTLFFQTADGPKLLLKVTGFTENYCRAVIVMFLGLFALTGLSCAIGALFGLPTAVFFTVSYLIIGMISKYLLGAMAKMEGVPVDVSLMEKIGGYASRLMISILIPIQDFFVSSLVSSGELVEWSFMGRLIGYEILLRGLPLFLLGAWLYRRRELGTAMKR